MKTILLAVPTAKYIETDTFKSIYDLTKPEGFEITFQHFYGYNIDQIRNLIAHWGLKYDFLFCVDSDIVLPKDALVKMLSAEVDIICGVYTQRFVGTDKVEVYRDTAGGGVTHLNYTDIQHPGVYEVAACGFGCVLVKNWVLKAIPYPHFVYHSALDHRNTISEDVDFCRKARQAGAKIYVDSSIVCNHLGSTIFRPATAPPLGASVVADPKVRIRDLAGKDMLPREHANYLLGMKKSGCAPKVIYDIGASTLHWARHAIQLWPEAKLIAFDGVRELEFLYQESNIDSYVGVLADKDDIAVLFNKSVMHPSGSSIYIEANINAPTYGTCEEITKTLDTVVAERKFPAPNLIKMDVQGSELSILKGASQALKTCDDLILELQHVEYNKGAPHKAEVIDYLKTIGFKLVSGPFASGPMASDGDYHFTRV